MPRLDKINKHHQSYYSRSEDHMPKSRCTVDTDVSYTGKINPRKKNKLYFILLKSKENNKIKIILIKIIRRHDRLYV